ncbi:MAG: AEC family transporter [Bacillota bacterium]
MAGYVAGKKLALDKGTVSKMCLYVLSPALTFNSLSTSEADLSAVWRLSGISLALPFVFTLVFSLVFKFVRFEKATSRGLLLATIFSNAGNYGLPVSLFAFGQEGMDFATVFFVVQGILLATYGVYVAASTKMDAKKALMTVLKMPAMYAALFGMGVKIFGIPVPQVIARPIKPPCRWRYRRLLVPPRTPAGRDERRLLPVEARLIDGNPETPCGAGRCRNRRQRGLV